MTDSMLLLALATLCFGIGLWVIFELLDSAARTREFDRLEREWWEARRKSRETPPEMSDSSLIDDYNSTLPREGNDGGPKAA